MNIAGRTSVVAVSGEEWRGELVDNLMLDIDGYDVVVVESVAHGYSRVKALLPDRVIVLLAMEDVGACQLFTMLATDGATAQIPVTTWTIRPALATFAATLPDSLAPRRSGAVQMH